MENQINFFREDNQKLEVTSFVRENLLEAVKWAKFLAIVGFVGVGILCLFGGLLFVLGMIIEHSLLVYYLFPIGLINLVVALICYFPVKYLYDFSRKMKNALNFTDNQALSESFSALKSHYKFVGILMIVVVLIYLINFFTMFLGAILEEGFGVNF